VSIGLVSDCDFLDPLAGDRPEGVWSLTYDTTQTLACLRSLAWPGYYFFAEIGGGEHGGVYFGNGVPNTDLAFML
jgi:radial spoke head protein 9